MEVGNLQQVMQMAEYIRQEIEKERRKLFFLSEVFKKTRIEEKKRLPYHINVIDELHINENGHSRILVQLLKYQNTRGEYEFLESIVRYIQQKKRVPEFENIVINRPEVTQEIERIDLWVRDSEYAIIFENKIYNARDQEEQISRYIDKTIEYGYCPNKIFVVYLSQSNSEPATQSWGKYKKAFKGRYVNLSFRNDILQWIKEDVLSNIKQKDVFLHSAVLQYIDYLEGLFHLRVTEKPMNMKLDNLIISQLELEGVSDKERISILQEKINDFNEITLRMQSLIDSYKQGIINRWRNKTKNSFPDLEPNTLNDVHADVTFHLGKKRKFFVYIIEGTGGKLYCQVEFESEKEGDSIENTPIMELADLLPDRDENLLYQYVGFWHEDCEEAYKLFVKVVKRAKEIIC